MGHGNFRVEEIELEADHSELCLAGRERKQNTLQKIKLFEIRPPASANMKRESMLSVACGRARSNDDLKRSNLAIKRHARIINHSLLSQIQTVMLCDSYCVLHILAPGFLVIDFAFRKPFIIIADFCCKSKMRIKTPLRTTAFYAVLLAPFDLLFLGDPAICCQPTGQ